MAGTLRKVHNKESVYLVIVDYLDTIILKLHPQLSYGHN